MNENEFEKQVEREEAAYSEPGQTESEAPSGTVNEIVAKIKDLVRKGNVTKIVIKKNDNILVNIPVNVGIVGGIIGVAAAPWAIIAAAVATAGFACKVEIVKNDGDVLEVSGKAVEEKAKDFGRDFEEKAKDFGKDFTEIAKDFGEKAKDIGGAVIDGIKDAVAGEKAEDADFESVVEEAEEAAGDPGSEE